jgi:hypothetical protein
MKIVKVRGFENTEFEGACKKLKIIRIIFKDTNWIKIEYKIPHGHKKYTMFLREGDIQ